MRFVIRHEGKKRLRVHMKQSRMTYEQADVLLYYLESMEEAMSGKGAVPQWYLALYGDRIAAGMGVIANDFHDRTDLTPNVCAVFTEPDFRCQGLAGRLLGFVADDMKSGGIDALYLLTSHDSFYERYGWEYLCPVTQEGNDEPSRMYVHRT